MVMRSSTSTYPQFEEMVAALVERRKGKMSEEDDTQGFG